MTVTRLTVSCRSQLFRLLAVLCIGAMHRGGAQAPMVKVHPANPGEVVLQPGDKVQLKIWREPDLSGEFVVSSDGIVILPKIGRVDVNLISTDSLRASLMIRYAGSLRDPAIEVTVLRRVNVVGSVRNPGFYYGDPTVTINGAVALAGGVTPDGNASSIELMHRGAREPIRFSRTSSLADSLIQSGDQVRVPQRSWLSRNTGFVGGGITAVAILIAATIRHY
jgi:protein involved in polysaccharide export with SLBB domain